MQVFYTDHHALPLAPGQRFPLPKQRLLRERLALVGAPVRLLEAPAASDGELALVHTPRWIGAVRDGGLSAAEQRELGFAWSPALAERARRSAGATIAAARAALDEGVAAQLGGGAHHAGADRGSGYCVFNDVAVAARVMQAESRRAGRGPLRVAVVDLDVHQGNGTAAIFRDDATVFTLSLHGANNYPSRKEPGDLDIELPDGCTDAPYLDALDTALASLWRAHADPAPGLVFYLAGADPHEGDRLGRLKLSAAALAERDRRVFAACRKRGVPLALTMAGGYGRSIDDTVAIHLQTLHAALASWQRWREPQAVAMEAPGAPSRPGAPLSAGSERSQRGGPR